MTRDTQGFLPNITELLQTPEYQGHPLHTALSMLWNVYRDQSARLDRVIQISDRYQTVSKENEVSLSQRFQKQARNMNKLARIADAYNRMMQETNASLHEASTHDVLTGLANRRYLRRRLQEESDLAARSGQPYAVLLLDIDHFKQVNDALGHAAGDQVLTKIAGIIQHATREHDACGRWGGEEFLLILPNTQEPGAMTLAQRICADIRDQTMPLGNGPEHVTASVGISTHRPGEDYDQTVHRADIALLAAKRQGRDRVVMDT